MKFFQSISFRVTLWYLTILSVMLVSLGCGIHMTLSHRLYHKLDLTLRERVEHLYGFRDVLSIIAGGTFEDQVGEYITFYYYQGDRLQNIAPKSNFFPVPREVIDRALSGETLFEFVDIPEKGLFRVLVSSFKPDNPVFLPDKSEEIIQKSDYEQWLRDEGFIPDPYRGSPAIPQSPEQGEGYNRGIEIKSAALVIARPTKDIETVLRQLFYILAIAIPLTLLLAGGGGIFLARRALNPVKKISDTARQIEENDLSRRIDVRTKDELGFLSETLNQMIERLENAFNRQKEFTSDASHELRGPLAVIQAEASLSLRKAREPREYRKTLEVIISEAERMAFLTSQLLELARMDANKGAYVFESIDFKIFLQEICSDIAILCKKKSLELQTHLVRQVQIKGDQKILRRMFFNILNNAIKYTEQGGTIRIALEEKNGMAEVSISDTGIGIPSDSLPYIFERFYRVDKARSRREGGSGLGLSICKHIIDVHKGRIDVNSQTGKGSVFIVKIPTI